MKNLKRIKKIRIPIANFMIAILAIMGIFCDRIVDPELGPVENTSDIIDRLQKASAGKGYKVTLEFNSYQRKSVFANDGGETDKYCVIPDLPANQCPPSSFPSSIGYIDGVKLKVYKNEAYYGLAPITKSAKTIEGSLNNINDPQKWEWPKEADLNKFTDPNSLRWTHRPIDELVEYSFNVFWDGNPITSATRVKWFESDPHTNDDISDWVVFGTGTHLTQCLQGGTEGQERTIHSGQFSVIHDDYLIQVWYNLVCKWEEAKFCGDGICFGGETWLSCPQDCPKQINCGDGFCDWDWGEDPFNCLADCDEGF